MLNWLAASPTSAAPSAETTLEAVRRIREPAFVLRAGRSGALGAASGGSVSPGPVAEDGVSVVAQLGPLYPEWLGDRTFARDHGVRFPLAAGSMANGIASAELVVALARAGILASFGAAGLAPAAIERGLDAIDAGLRGDSAAYASNLIHSPSEPQLEEATADLYIRRGVRHVETSAYMGLTPAVVRLACTGLHVGSDGSIVRRHSLLAKVSRPEVARHFLSPAPAAMLDALVAGQRLTANEAQLAARLPLACDVTVEADSGGHTDNRPLTAIFPVIARLRDALSAAHGYRSPPRVGAAGGIGTPEALAAAFGLGAAYAVTGSVNQAAVEAGLSPLAKALLARAEVSDVAMAAAADMFELGVKLQVLKRGTFFAARSLKLWELYRDHPSIDAIPTAERLALEQKVLGTSFDEIERQTRSFWAARDPAQLERATRDPRHHMALVFRWYLGKSSRWAIEGVPERQADFQIWCGPAMGAFNDWVRGSFLEPPESRSAVQISLNLLEGAAVLTRAQQLRAHGVSVPAAALDFRPRRLR
jgi:trans-AT polyketide synthase/acyltransferase/oxidoreductase domain-containing protein